MTPFYRFPHTPHLAWLGKGEPRDDKVLTPSEVETLLAGEVVVEEKIDGANLGFSVSEEGDLLAQNRGSVLQPGACHLQFRPLWSWLNPRREALVNALWPDLMLFGEWCHAVHSIEYSHLPAEFIAFDVYDRSEGRFWSTSRRNELTESLSIVSVPELYRGKVTLGSLKGMLSQSRFSDGPMEGVYLRRQDRLWLLQRAKLVSPQFTQAMAEHWSRRSMKPNHLAP